MTVRSVVRASSVAACVAILSAFFVLSGQARQASAAGGPVAGPSHQVIACYCHRTVRCPICQRISGYIEEAVRTGFQAELKAGSVKMAMVDFQDQRNRAFAQAYQITGPTLVLMDVHDGRVTSWKPAPKVWSLVGDKDQFFRYVQGEVQSYLEGEKTAAR